MKHSPAFFQLISEAKSHVRECDVHEVWHWLNSDTKFYLIDVREESEWGSGRIPGSLHIGKGIIERDIEATISDKAATLVLYSGEGLRSILAAENLARMGYQNVLSMAGGWRKWLDEGYPAADD